MSRMQPDIKAPARPAAYEEVASEYYDAARHPTCASLRELSLKYLLPRLANLMEGDGRLVEIGAGRSALAPAAASAAIRRLVLVDCSPAMLTYSSAWVLQGAQMVIAEAAATGLPAGCADLVLCSLGDPYNEPSFWREVARILRPGGACLFTAPSFEWASRFRPESEGDYAEFVRGDGALLLMPSYVRDPVGQTAMLADAGLEMTEESALTIIDLSLPPAPKLLCVPAGTPVVRGFTARRRAA